MALNLAFELPSAKKRRLDEEQRRFDQQVKLMAQEKEAEFDYQKKMLDLRTTAAKQAFQDQHDMMVEMGTPALVGRAVPDTGVRTSAVNPFAPDQEIAPELRYDKNTARAGTDLMLRESMMAQPARDSVGFRGAMGQRPGAERLGLESTERSILEARVGQAAAMSALDEEEQFRKMQGPTYSGDARALTSRSSAERAANDVHYQQAIRPFQRRLGSGESRAKLSELDLIDTPLGQSLLMLNKEQQLQTLRVALSEGRNKLLANKQVGQVIAEDPTFMQRALSGEDAGAFIGMYMIQAGMFPSDVTLTMVQNSAQNVLDSIRTKERQRTTALKEKNSPLTFFGSGSGGMRPRIVIPE